MKIHYKNKLKIINLILGFVWLGLGSSRMIIEDDFGWVAYAYVILGVVYFFVFYLQVKQNYILIKDDILIKKYDFWTKTMKLSELKSIRKFAGDYKLRSEDDELIINTQLIEEDDLVALNKVLEELDVEWK